MEKYKLNSAKKMLEDISSKGISSCNDDKTNDICVCIPIYGRHKIVHSHVIGLVKQDTDVLLGVSTLFDYYFANGDET